MTKIKLIVKQKPVIFSLAFITITACSLLLDLKTSDVYFCDQYKADQCELPYPDNERVYRPVIPASKTDSWYDLGYYMYFHTRQTPGLRVNFNRALSQKESHQLKKSASCSLTISTANNSHTAHMEGMRIDEDGFWCFDYLGSNLVALMKKNHQEKNKPVRSIFPIRLKIAWESSLPGIKGQKSTYVNIDWDTR